jgi:hypothetical protein
MYTVYTYECMVLATPCTVYMWRGNVDAAMWVCGSCELPCCSFDHLISNCQSLPVRNPLLETARPAAVTVGLVSCLSPDALLPFNVLVNNDLPLRYCYLG